MIRIICDRCGQEIAVGPIGYIAVNAKNSDTGDLLNDNEFEKKHYCMDCVAKIREFVKGTDGTANKKGPGQKASEPDQEGEKPERKGRKRIDIGKIMALKEAGGSKAPVYKAGT